MSVETSCGVRHVDLSAPLADLVPGDAEQMLLAVFEWHGMPLGKRYFSTGELPVPGAALAGIAADACAPALAALGLDPGEDASHLLEDVQAAAESVEGSLSVVICTRNRPHDLKRCLDSILLSAVQPDEILVVDNAPESDTTRAVVSEYPVTYVAEARPGLSMARNTGVAAAHGQFLVFTDDDVEVMRHWLMPLRAGFADPDVGCVTGLVLPAHLTGDAAFAFEVDHGGLGARFTPARYDRSLLDQPFGEAPPVWRLGAGANMAIRRAVIDDIGPFDLRLGAGAAGCSEDSEFWHRALAAGWVCRYQPLSAVRHHHRGTFSELRQQLRAYMRGHVSALFEQFAQTRHTGNLMRVFVGLPYHYVTTTLRVLIIGPATRRKTLSAEILGLLEGPLDWARRRRQPKFGNDFTSESNGVAHDKS